MDLTIYELKIEISFKFCLLKLKKNGTNPNHPNVRIKLYTI